MLGKHKKKNLKKEKQTGHPLPLQKEKIGGKHDQCSTSGSALTKRTGTFATHVTKFPCLKDTEKCVQNHQQREPLAFLGVKSSFLSSLSLFALLCFALLCFALSLSLLCLCLCVCLCLCPVLRMWQCRGGPGLALLLIAVLGASATLNPAKAQRPQGVPPATDAVSAFPPSSSFLFIGCTACLWHGMPVVGWLVDWLRSEAKRNTCNRYATI